MSELLTKCEGSYDSEKLQWLNSNTVFKKQFYKLKLNFK